MRIAHVLHDLDPVFGGLTTVPLNMARATADVAGMDVEVWTANAHGWTPPRVDTRAGSLQLLERPGLPGFLERGFVDRFRADLKRVDLVHVHWLWKPHTARLTEICRRINLPIVLTMHGMFMDWPMSQKTLKKKTYLKLVGCRQLRHTTAVQMLNAAESAQSRHVGVNYRYFELPNGVDVTEFAALPPRGAFRATDPMLRDKTIILTLGRLHPVKGVDLLLGAFLDLAKSRDDLALIIAGPDEGMLGKLQDMLRGHPAAERVRLPGLVRGAQRLALLSDADIYAHCSIHETMSMAIIEAAYAGKAMLVTDRCNCPEVAEADAGLVVPTNVESIRDGLGQLLVDRDQMPQRGAKARRLVEQRFTLQAVTPMLIDHYRAILDSRPFPWLLAER